MTRTFNFMARLASPKSLGAILLATAALVLPACGGFEGEVEPQEEGVYEQEGVGEEGLGEEGLEEEELEEEGLGEDVGND